MLCLCRQCCAISLYSICYSVIKPCNYWDSNTISAVVYFGTTLYNNTGINTWSSSDLPQKIKICGTDVHIQLQANYQGVVSDNAESKLNIASVICHCDENTGFLIWLGGYCISCIFHGTLKKKLYSILAYDEDHSPVTTHYIKNIEDKHTLVEAIFNLANTKLKDVIVNYEIQFLSCSSKLSNCERKRIMKKHRQNYINGIIEPALKKQKLEKRRMKYKAFDPAKKGEVLNKNLNYKRAMGGEQKQKLLENQREKYKALDQSKKEELLKKNLNYRKTIGKDEKQKLLKNQRARYKALDQSKKEEVLKTNLSYKKTMGEEQKNKLLENKRMRYQAMDITKKRELIATSSSKIMQNRISLEPEQKKDLLNREKEKRVEKKSKLNNIELCIEEFKKQIKAGPCYVCCVCNRTLYKKSVIILEKHKYPCQDYFVFQCSFDGNHYICKTCHAKLLKGQQPCQAVVNNLFVDETPAELAALEKLEQILVAQRIVFEKIVIMPKGQQRKIKGAICNIPVECSQTCNVLPRPPDRSGIILLKLKRKLEFRGHVYFQAVRPQFVISALNWLIANNPLYRNIEIQCGNISPELTNLNCPVTDQENIDEHLQTNVNREQLDQDAEEQDDPLNERRSAASETCLQSILPNYPVNLENTDCSNSTGREVFNIAPGEGKHPVSIMTDKLCEELSFPVLFPKGRFGYTAERDRKLSPIKYFNARLLHHSGKFATNPEYLFFAQFIMEQKKISDSINIALKKVHGQSVTASQVKSNSQAFQNLLLQDQAYLFLRQIPGSPPYWQKFMYEVVAMVKQLGIPTWFMTLSCADLRWPELFQIIARTKGNNMTDEEVEALSYHDRCSMLNLNPVIVAKHFQYRVETFFRQVLLTNANPIGKIVYYALRIEFQMRGSPHLHALIWTSDCPELTNDTKDAYIDYIDQHVQAYLPGIETDPELYDLVKTYQTHNHSKTCRKYKNVTCRFNFGQFFTDRTIIAEPLAEDMDDQIKSDLLTRRKEILSKVKQKIDDVLNPSKSTYEPNATPNNILSYIGITEQDYKWAISVSPDSDYELHLKRPIDSCFINNYFIAGLKGFAANVDLQPVFNHYKCITYVCSYFTKHETECSQAIINAAKEAKQANLSVRDGLRKIGAAFLSTREVSAQECVYRCMPELWLRKIFPKTVFVSTDFAKDRVRVAKTPQELDDLDDDSTDIFKTNIIVRYSDRPKNIPVINDMCLALFAAHYFKDY